MCCAKRLISLVLGLVLVLGICSANQPALAEKVDGYVRRYLRAREPVPIALNGKGDTRLFSAADLSVGKELFDSNCKTCHVGGATLPNPVESLSLEALQGATPPRDNIASLITFQRMPMIYDGTSTSFWCREVNEDWLSDEELTLLDAFILRAAQAAPGWGAQDF